MNFGTEPDGRPRDGMAFVVHGVCGLFAGALIGAFGLGREAMSSSQFWSMVGVCALVIGLLCALFGDRFWGILMSLFRWF